MNRGEFVGLLKEGDKVEIYYCDTSATVVWSEEGIVGDGVIKGKYNIVDFSSIDGCYTFIRRK